MSVIRSGFRRSDQIRMEDYDCVAMTDEQLSKNAI